MISRGCLAGTSHPGAHALADRVLRVDGDWAAALPQLEELARHFAADVTPLAGQRAARATTWRGGRANWSSAWRRRARGSRPASRRRRAPTSRPSPSRSTSTSATMDFAFLYNLRKKTLSVGYDAAVGRARELHLRPAGVRGADCRLRGHRQGRRPAGQLVPPRAHACGVARDARARVVDGHDVRVPDAGHLDASLPAHAHAGQHEGDRAAAAGVHAHPRTFRGASPSPGASRRAATSTAMPRSACRTSRSTRATAGRW